MTQGEDSIRSAAVMVDLWTVWLVPPGLDMAALRDLLSEGEQRRADRFRFERDRQRYVVSQAALRQILGGYLDRPPGGIVFDVAPGGKPFVSGTPWRFNLSHSGDLAVLAVCRGREVGVDIEEVRPLEDYASISEQFFSVLEVERLREVPMDERVQAFFECWTRKEAYLKALGCGLQAPLDRFSVSIGEDLPVRLLEVEWDSCEVERWTILGFEPARGVVGALVVEGAAGEVRRREWPRSNRA